MSRIDQKFKELKKAGKKALVTFITAGDPNLAETEKLVYTLEKAGADIIELGIPFSDPMADGPVIQLSYERALKKGSSIDKIFALVTRIRKKSQVPLLLMGYYNPIFVMGHEVFAKKAKDAGVDAVLIVDLPPDEADDLNKILKAHGINLVFLLAPTSTDERIKKAAHKGSGFIYYVSMTGITGAKLSINDELSSQVLRIKGVTSRPVVVGFGISKPEQVREIAHHADGVVIGSALIKLIEKNAKNTSTLHKSLSRFVASLKKAI
ncbi:tryptophan synthase subunit alpha [bacterium]|nr:tryptophan synthase subunit alpha [bacterium]